VITLTIWVPWPSFPVYTPPGARTVLRIIRVAAVAVLVSAAPAAAQSIIGPPRPGEPPRLKIETPEHFFGFRMGADNKMAHWNDMVRYYDLLGKTSGRMKVVNLGKTSEGRPFYALFISSPANLAKLEAFRRINATIADPRGVPDDSLETLTRRGKAVVLQSMSMHSTEIGGSQMAVELVYDLLSRTDAEANRILDNVIAIVIPSSTPTAGNGHDGRKAVRMPRGHRRRGSTRSTLDTTTTVTRSSRTCPTRSTSPGCSSGSGFRRPTSIITTWEATARASTCRHTPSRCVHPPIRSSGANSRGTAATWLPGKRSTACQV
jgi:hypothetical protein